MMKLVILSAYEVRHKFFLGNINAKYKIEKIIIEKKSIKPKFKTFHEFEKKREKFEKNNFPLTKFKKIDNNVFFFTNNINNKKVLKKLKEIMPDIILVCGTRIISSNTVSMFKNRIYNFHGGDLEKYRGLDSHLWAIYNNDFNSLKTTLHRLKSLVDTGNILLSKKLKIDKKIELYHLRYLNFKKVSELAVKFLDKIYKKKKIKEIKLKKIGRYYSFMPSILKNVCIDNFYGYKKSKIK